MVRVRKELLKFRMAQELQSYMGQRLVSALEGKQHCLATDYLIRLLSMKGKDPQLLACCGTVAATMEQHELAERCESQLSIAAASKSVWSRDIAHLAADMGPLGDFESITVSDTDSTLVTEEFSKSGKLELRETESFGRGLYAKENIRKGDILFKETPFASFPFKPNVCENCLSSISGGVAHPSTGRTFCSERCLTEAQMGYYACQVNNEELSMLTGRLWEDISGTDVEGVEARALLTCLAAIKLCCFSTCQQVHPLKLPAISCLRGTAWYDPKQTLAHTGALAVEIATALRQQFFFLEDLIALYAVIQANEFVTSRGSYLFTGMSMLNHSCVPNTEIVPPSESKVPQASLRALADVPAGEQLFIDYTGGVTGRLTYEQRRRLCGLRGFECTCPRCALRLD